MKLIISFITYNESTTKYLDFLLESLKKSILVALSNNVNISPVFFVFDNSDKKEAKNKEILHKFFLDNNYAYKIWGENENIGFARAYNIMINEAVERELDFFLAINPDIILEEDFILKIISKVQNHKDISVFCPKILYWDFISNSKTNKIDSYGVSFKANHRFFDRGQGLTTDKYSDKEQEIFGFSGAGVLFKLSKILDVAYFNDGKREFFDEMMFMYKEDVDLSYRLQLAGKKVLFAPDAVMYHDRSLSSVNNRLFDKIFFRKINISASHSYLNQLIILYKIKKLPFSFKVGLLTKIRKILLILFGLLFERKSLKKFVILRSQIKQKYPKTLIKKDEIRRIEEFI